MTEVQLPEIQDWVPDDSDKRRIAKYANRLQLVTWDRFISFIADDRKTITMYGWIRRPDQYKDFVVLRWSDFDHNEFPWCTTSSAKHSAEIAQLLYGDEEWYDPNSHEDCVRAEDHFEGYLNWMIHA